MPGCTTRQPSLRASPGPPGEASGQAVERLVSSAPAGRATSPGSLGPAPRRRCRRCGGSARGWRGRGRGGGPRPGMAEGRGQAAPQQLPSGSTLAGPAPGPGARADLACSFAETPQTGRRLRPLWAMLHRVCRVSLQVYAKVSELFVCSWFLCCMRLDLLLGSARGRCSGASPWMHCQPPRACTEPTLASAGRLRQTACV